MDLWHNNLQKGFLFRSIRRWLITGTVYRQALFSNVLYVFFIFLWEVLAKGVGEPEPLSPPLGALMPIISPCQCENTLFCFLLLSADYGVIRVRWFIWKVLLYDRQVDGVKLSKSVGVSVTTAQRSARRTTMYWLLGWPYQSNIDRA